MNQENKKQFFHASVLRYYSEDVGVFANSEQEAKKKILAVYEENGMGVLAVRFLQKTEESWDKKIKIPTTEHSTPK